MATTKPKEIRSLARSNSLTSPTQRNIKQSTTPAASAADHKDKSSTSTEKPIPNYLKPTLSSRPEPLKSVKKNGIEDHQKLTRRRSLDRPPSASPRLQKSLISPDPKERAASLREKPTTLRSSSFPVKPFNNAPKPISDKAAKTPNRKAGKSPSRGNLKKSTSASASSASKKVPATRGITDQTLIIETRHEEKESFVHEDDDEEIVKVSTEVEIVVPEEPKSEKNGQVLDSVDSGVEICDQEEKSSCDVSTISEDYMVSKTAQTEDKLGEEKIDNEGQADENHISKLDEAIGNQIRELDEAIDNHPEENSREEAKIEAEDKGDEENYDVTNEKEASSEETVDENKIEAKIDDEGSQLELKSSMELEEDVEGGVNEEAKPEAAAKHQGGQGKKESPGAYNDVIKETASKLLEKRKNKVKALVGAFETVIDYESSSK